MTTSSEVKRLFFMLIREVGGVQPAAAYLGVSHQRISQLQNLGNKELPSIMQIVTLEEAVGKPIVTGGLAAMIETERPKDLMEEVCEATEAVASLQSIARRGGDVKPALMKAASELGDVFHAIGEPVPGHLKAVS